MRPVGDGSAANEIKPLVIYVEDEELNFRVAEQILGDKYNLVHVRNARELCARLHVSSRNLYAILMDIQLIGSDLDGIQLTRLLRGTLPASETPDELPKVEPVPDLPILFLTAYGSMYSESVLINAGGNRLISKPVNPAQLELALTKIHLDHSGFLSIPPAAPE